MAESAQRSALHHRTGGSALLVGKHRVRVEFANDGGGLAKGGTVTLYLDVSKAGEGRVDHDHLIGSEERLHLAIYRQ